MVAIGSEIPSYHTHASSWQQETDSEWEAEKRFRRCHTDTVTWHQTAISDDTTYEGRSFDFL